MNSYLIDTHTHLNSKKYAKDQFAVIQRAFENNIKRIINIGFDLQSSKESVLLADKYDEIFAVVGVHPHDAKTLTNYTLKELEELAQNKKVLAIGEIGLDFYRDLSPRPVQREAFRKQIELAQKLDLPIVVHDRDAHNEILQILEEMQADKVLLHCFSGNIYLAEKCKKRGYYLGIGGPVTFTNNKKLPPVVEEYPLEWLVLETDCPYLTPTPHRGKRNEPSYVKLVAERVAELRGMTLGEIASRTWESAHNLFDRLKNYK